jgi:hypothetical protein
MCSFHLSFRDSSHYENIIGEQNLYFDFDGRSSEGGTLETINLTDILSKIRNHLESLNIKRYCILIYSSSDSIKESYHILVRGIHFASHIQCGMTARTIASSIESFDSSIYTSRRFFRMIGSRKRDGTRRKRFHSIHNTGYYSDIELADFKDTKREAINSLITFIDKERSTLVGNGNESEPSRAMFKSTFQWDEDKIQVGMSLINDRFPGIYRRGEISNNSIKLIRVKSYECPICDGRRHDSDGGELIYRNGVYSFMCWRNPGKYLALTSESNEEETMEIEVVPDEHVDEHENLVQSLVARVKMSCSFVG